MIDLGSELALSSLPAALEVNGHPYFLTVVDGQYRLLSRVCPHQGGVVVEAGSCFECPQHGWRFAQTDGCGIDVPTSRLTSFPVVVRDGHLWADVIETPQPVLAGRLPVAKEGRRAAQWPTDFAVRLIGHACLEITHAGFTLLTDPWLTGPAFLGAWMPYPVADVDVASLRPDAIWISHEHSDHFHPATLAHFDRSTPVFVPDFPNERLAKGLAALGFTRVERMRFGQRYTIGPEVHLTCYEPPGLWNDSILLVEAGDVRLLNINDAGVNHRVAATVGRVDILASAYNPASSYPFAWTHLAADAKEKISERARLGMLRMLHQAVKCYQPQYLLPFAAHFTLWHPTHREYLSQLRRNSLDDVVKAFRHTTINVLDMLPGGEWRPAADVFERGAARDLPLYDADYQSAWVSDAFDEELFATHHPASGPLSRGEVEEYLLRLNEVPDIAFCEDLSVRLCTDESVAAGGIDLMFRIEGGRLSIIDAHVGDANLTMQMPQGVLRHLVLHDASWDEAHVGFWCRFTRTPDVFHAGFWRLLQAPYYRRSPQLKSLDVESVAAVITVAELIERHGDAAERILARYGLHCSSCPHGVAEPVLLAAQRHGVPESMAERLLCELGETMAASPAVLGAR